MRVGTFSRGESLIAKKNLSITRTQNKSFAKANKNDGNYVLNLLQSKASY